VSKPAKIGSGKRFKSLANKLARKGAENPKALSAWIGARKYGQGKMTKMSQAGKKRHEHGHKVESVKRHEED
jgi:hypothetical protein